MNGCDVPDFDIDGNKLVNWDATQWPQEDVFEPEGLNWKYGNEVALVGGVKAHWPGFWNR
jgi:hypothetical protein